MTENRSKWLRFGKAASFLVVGGVAAYVSYRHIYEVALLAHQPRVLAAFLPLSVDGLLLMASIAMAEDKAEGRHPRGWARSGFWLGATASVAANLGSTWVHYGPQPFPLFVAAWAPIALLWCVEIVSRKGKLKANEVAAPSTELRVPAPAEMQALPEAPVSPAPARKVGRPSIPATVGPNGKAIHAETGEALKVRTEYRKRTGK